MNWMRSITGDIDLGGSGALLVDVAGVRPSQLIVSLGKDGNAYLLNRTNLGGGQRGPSPRRTSEL